MKIPSRVTSRAVGRMPDRSCSTRLLCAIALWTVVVYSSDSAQAQVVRCTFEGTIISIYDQDFGALDFAIGASVDNLVRYIFVFDFDADAEIDGEAVNLGDFDFGDLHDGFSIHFFFADLIAGSLRGGISGACEAPGLFGALSATGELNLGITQTVSIPAVPDLVVNSVMVGGADDVVILNIDFDGTPDGLEVGSTIAGSLEQLCDFDGGGSPVIFISELTLTDKRVIANAREPGGVGSFVGRITDATKGGAPVECATVVAFVGNSALGAGATNQDGDYEIPNLGFGEYDLEVFAPDRAAVAPRTVTLAGLAALENFTLQPESVGAVIEGITSDKNTGDPLAGVQVLALGVETRNVLAQTFSCATGRYQLRDFSETKGTSVIVIALAEGYELTADQVVTIGSQDVDFALEKQLVPGLVIGTITEESNAGLAGASVAVQGLSNAVSHVGTTDGNGLYLVPNLPSGQYTVNISAPNFMAETIVPIEIGSGAVALDLMLSPGQTPPPQANDSTGEGSAAAGCGASAFGRSGPLSLGDFLVVGFATVLLAARRRRDPAIGRKPSADAPARTRVHTSSCETL